MRLLFLLIIVLGACGTVKAQDNDSTANGGVNNSFWTWNRPATTSVERITTVTGASLLYSLVDYYGFNLIVRKWHNSNSSFQVMKSLLQLGVSYLLDQTFGISSVVAFNLIWWTWGDDIAYYGWSYFANSFPWEDRTENGFRFPNYTWAHWTPIGLLRSPGSPIHRDTLIGQATIGLSVSFAILW